MLQAWRVVGGAGGAGPSWAVPVRTTSFRSFGTKAGYQWGSSGQGRDDLLLKGQTRYSDFPDRNLDTSVLLHRGYDRKQVIAFVLFDSCRVLEFSRLKSIT